MRIGNLRISWLDLTLGARMLVKFPVLTIVGGFSMAFAIWVGAGTFEILRQFVYPVIPLPDASQLVVLKNWDAANSRYEPRLTQDLLAWRQSVTTVTDLGAFRSVERNLTVTEGSAEPVAVAEMHAATFRALRVAPLLGRSIVEADEVPSAPLAVVIGFELWQRRFQGDPNIVGRNLKVGGKAATVVGVMPEGFGFPRSQELWTALKLDPSADFRQGAALDVVGRLANGVTLEQARVELTRIGSLVAADQPATHEHLRPRVMTFSESVHFVAEDDVEMVLYGHFFIVMLVTLICANVGLLMFARAATRETELVVRNALGAGRARIVMQLFAEALVLGSIAAVIGLTAAAYGLDWALTMLRGVVADGNGRYPFWVTGSLSPLTVVYAALLTVLAAVVAGVLPGLRVTRGLGERLRSASAGGGGAGFGGVWTLVIALQIAVTMGFPVATFFVRNDAKELESSSLPVPIDEFLALRLDLERTAAGDSIDAAFQARFVAAVGQLESKLLGDPAVEGLAFAQLLPRQYHPNRRIEVDEGAVAPADERGHIVGSAAIEPQFFDLLGVQMLSGRPFTSGDLIGEARVAIVNASFVQRVLGGKNPLGRRLRYPAAQDSSWYEIVGMVPDVGIRSGWGAAGIYHPLQRAAQHPLRAALRVTGDPAEFVPRLRAMATEVDETLQVSELMPLTDVADDELSFQALWVRLTTTVSVIVLVMSLVAIYAVMSYTVSRRTREIGIRVALGASPGRVVRAVFAQPIKQIAWGLVAGVALVFMLIGGLDSRPSATNLLLLVVVAVSMTLACMLACLVPTLRALAIQPMEALRSD